MQRPSRADAFRRGNATRVARTRQMHVAGDRMMAKRRFRSLLPAAGLLGLLMIGVFAGSAIGSRAHESKARVANSVLMTQRTFHLAEPDQKQRLTVGCPGRSAPLGGGMTG